MAEAYLKEFANDEFEAESAGFEPGVLNPLAVEVMAEEGIDISKNSVDSLFDFFRAGKRFNYIITVCDEGAAQKCPIFPGVLKRIHWSFEDPSSFNGSHNENLSKTRFVRDAIKSKVQELVSLINGGKVEENFPKDWKLM
jgi:arsenate reductase